MTDRPVILCYDGSLDAALAIEHAGDLFPGRAAIVLVVWQGARAQLNYAWPGVSVVPDLDALDKASEKAAKELATAGAYAAGVAGLLAEPLAVRAHGSVWPAILATGDDCDAAAVVIGSRGLSELKSVLLGSVSSGVVHHATRPVVVVSQRTPHLAMDATAA